jgi:hypothetical protein
MVLAALKGSTNSYLRGVLVRRWTALKTGTADTLLETSCNLSADLLDGSLQFKPKPEITPEAFIELVRKRVASATPFGEVCVSANQPRLDGFCIRLERDALPQWKAEDPDAAEQFMALKPVLRSPFNILVYEKRFPASRQGLQSWRSHCAQASYVSCFPAIRGLGEV